MSDVRLGVVGGTGKEGRGLVLRFALAGASVVIGSRDRDRAVALAGHLREQHPTIVVEGASNENTIEQCDVVLLAVPFEHAGTIIDVYSRSFKPGALLVDVTIPVVFEGGVPRFVAPEEGSAAEHLRRRLPPHVALACAFKTLPARLLEHVDRPLDCDEFVCGDSDDSRARALALVGRIPSLRAVDAGPLESARTLERMTLLAILLNKRYKRHDARFQVLGI